MLRDLQKIRDPSLREEIRFLLGASLAQTDKRDEARAVLGEIIAAHGKYASQAKTYLAAMELAEKNKASQQNTAQRRRKRRAAEHGKSQARATASTLALHSVHAEIKRSVRLCVGEPPRGAGLAATRPQLRFCLCEAFGFAVVFLRRAQKLGVRVGLAVSATVTGQGRF